MDSKRRQIIIVRVYIEESVNIEYIITRHDTSENIQCSDSFKERTYFEIEVYIEETEVRMSFRLN